MRIAASFLEWLSTRDLVVELGSDAQARRRSGCAQPLYCDRRPRPVATGAHAPGAPGRISGSTGRPCRSTGAG